MLTLAGQRAARAADHRPGPGRHRPRAAPGLPAILAAVLLQGCAGPDLQPWHTEELDEEFTARRADDFRSLDDYLAMESRLFEELDQKVYAEVPTGPEQALNRYSGGSAADVRRGDPNWNRTFELQADHPKGAVLLIHGMSDSPYSLHALGVALNRAGYRVLGLRLPGHGTAPSGLRVARWQDMVAAVRLAVSHLSEAVGQRPVHLVGYSTGALLAIDYALDAREGTVPVTPASLVLISPAIAVTRAAAFAPWQRRLGAVPGFGRLAWLQVEPEFDPYKYNSFSTNAAEQVYRLTQRVRRRIGPWSPGQPPVLPPMLIFSSAVDATVLADALPDRFLPRLAPERHELILFDINRFAAPSSLIINDPGPLTRRLLDAPDLPFTVTFVTNGNPETRAVVALRKPPGTATTDLPVELGLAWPPGILSLSHVALPIPPEDPLYGAEPPENPDALYLGQHAVRGERGLLKIPESWLFRLRHNPFYAYLEARALGWVDDKTTSSAAGTPPAHPPGAD